MYEHDRGAVALVEVCHPQAVELGPVRLKRKFRQALKQLIGSSDRVGHTGNLSLARYRSQLPASEATVTSIVEDPRAQAIRSSDCRRSSIA
jgi:hypothetical protein